jgi:4-amino-4-deoxy-L-arabinose transferase-like glycosyltransferase
VSTHAARLERTRDLRLHVLLLGSRAAPLALGGLSLVLILLTWNTWGNPASDTGYDTLAGIRVAHGQLPYVDFPYYYGPLAPLGLGLASLIGGAGAWPSIGFGIVVALAIVFATYALAASLAGPRGGFLAGALVAVVAFAPTELSFVNPHTTSATLGVLAALAFLLCLRHAAEAAGRRWLVAVGACAGISALTRYEFAAAIFVAAAVWLVLRLRGRMSTWRDVGAVAAPAVLIPAAVYGAFLTAVPLHRLVYDNLYPKEFLNAAGNVVLRSRMPWTVSSFASLGSKLVLYALGVLALIVLARLIDRGGRLRTLLLVLCALGGSLAIVAAVADSEALRHGLEYAYGWIPAGAGAVALVLVWRHRRPTPEWGARQQTELAVAISLAVAAATTYNGFFIEAFMPQMAVYVLPLAAVFLVSLHLRELAPNRTARILGAVWLTALLAATAGLVLKDASAQTATVSSVGGSIAALPADAPAYRAAVSAIEHRTRPGEPILLAPQLTWLYALTERSNPLPQLSLLPGVLVTDAEQRAAIARLKAANVRLAVVDVHPFPAYDAGSFGVSYDRTLAQWIARSFRKVAVVPVGDTDARLEIWSRRNS